MLYFHELLHSEYWLHGVQGVKQGAVIFFWVLQNACLFYLFTACQARPAGNTSLFIVLWCSEDVSCYSCLVADDRGFMLLMRQETEWLFPWLLKGKETSPFSHTGREQQVQGQSLGPLGSQCY